MASGIVKITEKESVQALLESASVLITQQVENDAGDKVESLRRVPLSVFFAEIYDARNDDVESEDQQGEYDSVGDFLRALSKKISGANLDVDLSNLDLIAGDDGKIYLYDKKTQQTIGDGIEANFGGGGSGRTVSLKAEGSTSMQIMDGSNASFGYILTIKEDGDPVTETATARYYVEDMTEGYVLKDEVQISTGINTWDCTQYVKDGAKTNFRIIVTDSEGATKTLPFSITSISIRIADVVDEAAIYTGDLDYAYTPYGAVAKTLHITVDGDSNEIITKSIGSGSGRQRSETIPKQTHGAHRIKAWVSTTIDGAVIPSNVLTHELIWVTEGAKMPVIASPFAQATAQQGEIIEIPMLVYDPANPTAEVSLRVNGTEVATLSVPRTQQTWTITDYPSGEVTFTIYCKSGTSIAQRDFVVNVTEVKSDVEVTTRGAVLMLSAAGRNNSEAAPAIGRWSCRVGDTVATLSNFNYRSNGWMGRYLRVSGAARVDIPLQPFAENFRSTGRTIEMEVVFRDVQDRDAPVISCMSGGIGMELTARNATFSSDSTTAQTVYGEGLRMRIAFAVEPRTSSEQLIHAYINGFGYRAAVYTDQDNFGQTPPVNISIGSDHCSVDVYSVNVYNRCLSAEELLENYIASRDTIAEREELIAVNAVYGDDGDISLEECMKLYPAMLIIGELPKSKDDTNDRDYLVDIIFYNPDNPSRNFTIRQVPISVQGTSSQYYVIKNYKFKRKGNGEYELVKDSIGETVFCLKANYMDSSGKRNTGAANFIHTVYTEKTPGQIANEKARTTIEGYSIVLFHAETENDTPEFVGLYDFNLDKSSTTSLGLTDPEKHQAWEICNNTSARCLFRSSDFEAAGIEKDFEARYPKDYTDYSALHRLAMWIVSCDGDLEKFKVEQPKHLNKHYMIIYAIMCMVLTDCDGLAKNMMLLCWNIGEENEIWYIVFYDIDSIIMVNNEGYLKFEPGYDFTDMFEGATVFNGAGSLLWELVMGAFFDEIAEEYRKMRADGRLSVDKLMQYFHADNLDASAALYNADGYFKYIAPMHDGDNSNLYAYQGPGDVLFRWWLENSIAAFDGKFKAAPYMNNYITLRLATPQGVMAGITLTRYNRGYLMVKYGSHDSSANPVRAEAGVPTLVRAPAAALTLTGEKQLNDTETIIYDAQYITSLGDLSSQLPGSVKLANAPVLEDITVGSGEAGYQNLNLNEVEVGTAPALLRFNARNCPNFTGNLNLSGAPNIREVLTAGAGISTVTLPIGGYLRTLEIDEPTQIVVQYHQTLETFTYKSLAKLGTLRVDGATVYDWLPIIQAPPALARVRMTEVDWELPDASLLLALAKKKGIDDSGDDTAVATITGKAHLAVIGKGQKSTLKTLYPGLTITADEELAPYTVQFVNVDGTVLDTQSVEYKEAALEPVSAGRIATPTRANDVSTGYTFKGWSRSFDSVTSNLTIVAEYEAHALEFTVKYIVNFEVVETHVVSYMESAPYEGEVPSMAEAGKFCLFAGWSDEATNVTSDMNIHALWHKSDLEPEKKAFADCNPAEVIRIIDTGHYKEYWEAGEEQTITLENGRKITCYIADFEYHDLVEGGKACVTFMFHWLLDYTWAWNSTGSNKGGYPKSTLFKTCEDVVYAQYMPYAWKQVMKPWIRRSSAGGGNAEGNDPYAIVECEVHMAPASVAEFNDQTSVAPYNAEAGKSYTNASGTLVAYPLQVYTNAASRIKKMGNGTGAAADHWTCSPLVTSASVAWYINTNGPTNTNTGVSNAKAAALCFCR